MDPRQSNDHFNGAALMKFRTYFQQQRAWRGVTIGIMTQMILDLEEEMPGAGKMLIDQIPDGCALTDLVKALAIDMFHEDEEKAD